MPDHARQPRPFRSVEVQGHRRSPRFPLIIQAVSAPKVRSCLIDGEAVVCDENGLAVPAMRRKREGKQAFLYAFDLL
jgi:ATP-dependent DNA ligase